ncbi:MAG TPA: TraR/DksA family transcriptional regulator [Burkholderiales bacterium]|nr:TraR/DksA family transcriptional regulator [Burkholderiales bacterium]
MDDFTKKQYARLASILDAFDKRTREDIRVVLLQSGDQRYIDLAGMVHDTADESVADVLAELDNQLIERHLHELSEIEAARKRLTEHKINSCIECGGEIGFERLVAYPVAVRCFVCQEQFEKTHAHEATPRL